MRRLRVGRQGGCLRRMAAVAAGHQELVDCSACCDIAEATEMRTTAKCVGQVEPRTMERPFSSVPGRAARSLRDGDVVSTIRKHRPELAMSACVVYCLGDVYAIPSCKRGAYDAQRRSRALFWRNLMHRNVLASSHQHLYSAQLRTWYFFCFACLYWLRLGYFMVEHTSATTRGARFCSQPERCNNAVTREPAFC